jgi:hypothetical protein
MDQRVGFVERRPHDAERAMVVALRPGDQSIAPISPAFEPSSATAEPCCVPLATHLRGAPLVEDEVTSSDEHSRDSSERAIAVIALVDSASDRAGRFETPS